MQSELRRQFELLYGKKPVLAAAPGRVNLIGEHTDYNQGLVLPGAIDKKIWIAVAATTQPVIRMHANQFQESFHFSSEHISPVKGWATYLLGVISQFQRLGCHLRGLDILVDGNIPLGAGMSSSAALCSGFGLALNDLFSLGLSRMDLAVIGQKTEHEFAGVQCGIMDQFASLHGQKGKLIQLDCRSLDYKYVPFDFPEISLVLVNTMVSHSLAASEYNVRRSQCEEGVQLLKKFLPDITSLRDLSIEALLRFKPILPGKVYRRCHFVVAENDRVLKGCSYLEKGDLKSFGELMFEAHDGLSKEYEVSCPESDFLVLQARPSSQVVGARQMGGGFGGCVLHLVQREYIDRFCQDTERRFQQEFGKTPQVYTTQIEEGAKIIAD